MQKYAIINARILTPVEDISGGTVFIENRVIKKIIRKKSLIPRDFSIIDAKNRILCPGFIDIHIQGGGGSDVIDSTKTDINKVSTEFAKYGTTAFLATTNTKPDKKKRTYLHLKQIVDVIKEGAEGAQILGIHLEGPFINPQKKGMIRRDYIQSPDINQLKKIIDQCCGYLKMMTIAPELKGNISLIKELKKHKIIASLGHTEATYEEIQKGIKAGINHVTHMFNAMRPINHREPGAAGAALESTALSVQVIADFIHLHPAIVNLIIKLKGSDNTVLITDAVRAALMPDGIYTSSGQKVIAKNGIVRGENGILAGSTLTMSKAVHNVTKLGFELGETIKMATLTPARILGLKNKGMIKEGMDADLILIDKKINVYLTMVGGRIVWKK